MTEESHTSVPSCRASQGITVSVAFTNTSNKVCICAQIELTINRRPAHKIDALRTALVVEMGTTYCKCKEIKVASETMEQHISAAGKKSNCSSNCNETVMLQNIAKQAWK